MTVITKPSGIISKQFFVNPPQLEFESSVKGAKSRSPPNEEKVDISTTDVWPKRHVSNGLCCVLLWVSLLVFLGLVVGMMLYQQYVRPSPVRRYQAFCSIPIPIPNDLKENLRTDYLALPVRWSSNPDVQIISTVDDGGEDFVNALREELDLGDRVEKISVVNNGHRVDFIHDFNDNTTGIVDDDRCFVMDLEPELVLSPELFISGLESGGQFDVSRVRSNMRAALPALQQLSRVVSEFAERCFSRPIYKLYRDGSVIRKRSAEDPPHDYMQFSGKHVLELKINNLPEVLAYESKIKKN